MNHSIEFRAFLCRLLNRFRQPGLLFVLLLAGCLGTAGCSKENKLVAGDASELQIIGFSQDGKYMAYCLTGVQDGSGIPYCEVYVLDVAGNSYASRPFRSQLSESQAEQASLEHLRSQVLQSAAATLQAHNIVTDNVGETLFYHPPSDHTSDGYTAKFSTFPYTYSPAASYLYALKLTEKPAGAQCMDFDTKMLQLVLEQGENSKILQDDARLPNSRRCTYKYRIERAVRYGEQLVVFLNRYSPGFEGPDIRHMAVSGTLTFK